LALGVQHEIHVKRERRGHVDRYKSDVEVMEHVAGGFRLNRDVLRYAASHANDRPPRRKGPGAESAARRQPRTKKPA
jgi:hypothetical protein